MEELTFDNSDIESPVFKNKSKCFILNDVVYIKNESRAKLYYNNKRLCGFVNRDFLHGDILHWGDCEYPTLYFSDEVLNTKIDESIDELFLLYDDYEWQYAHFLIDAFPKLWYYIKLIKDLPMLKIGINNNIRSHVKTVGLTETVNYDTTFIYEYIKLYLDRYKLKYETSVVHLNYGTCYHIKKLILPIPYMSADIMPFPYRAWEMYDILKRDINIINGYEKIYISRRDVSSKNWMHYRVLLNENEIIHRLEDVGYKEIQLMNYSVENKIQIFKSANKIIQLVGSNCYNLAYIEPKVKCAILYHPYYACWSDYLKWMVEYRAGKYFEYKTQCKIVENPESYYPENYNKNKIKIDSPWTFDGVEELIKTIEYE